MAVDLRAAGEGGHHLLQDERLESRRRAQHVEQFELQGGARARLGEQRGEQILAQTFQRGARGEAGEQRGDEGLVGPECTEQREKFRICKQRGGDAGQVELVARDAACGEDVAGDRWPVGRQGGAEARDDLREGRARVVADAFDVVCLVRVVVCPNGGVGVRRVNFERADIARDRRDDGEGERHRIHRERDLRPLALVHGFPQLGRDARAAEDVNERCEGVQIVRERLAVGAIDAGAAGARRHDGGGAEAHLNRRVDVGGLGDRDVVRRDARDGGGARGIVERVRDGDGALE